MNRASPEYTDALTKGAIQANADARAGDMRKRMKAEKAKQLLRGTGMGSGSTPGVHDWTVAVMAGETPEEAPGGAPGGAGEKGAKGEMERELTMEDSSKRRPVRWSAGN